MRFIACYNTRLYEDGKVINQRDSICADSSFGQCSQAGLPSNFCCPPRQACIPLPANATLLCCPNGTDCWKYNSSLVISGNKMEHYIWIRLRRQHSLLTSWFCGDGCCPFGCSCTANTLCEMNVNQEELPPFTTTNSTVQSPSPTAPSSQTFLSSQTSLAPPTSTVSQVMATTPSSFQRGNWLESLSPLSVSLRSSSPSHSGCWSRSECGI